MPQQQRAIETRQVILLGAARVIDRVGYDAARIDTILAESGVTKGALYFHFASKEEVAEAIIAEQGEWLARHTGPSDTPIQDMVDVSFDFAETVENDVVFRASVRMTVERGAMSPTAGGMYEPWVDATAEYLRAASRQKKLIPGLRAPLAARVVTSAITGLQISAGATGGDNSFSEPLSEMWRLILPGLVRPELVAAVDVRPVTARRRRKAGDRI